MNIEQERVHGFGSYLSIRCTTIAVRFQIFTQSAFYDVDTTSAENVALVTVTSQKQNAVFGKVIIKNILKHESLIKTNETEDEPNISFLRGNCCRHHNTKQKTRRRIEQNKSHLNDFYFTR
jgi:hypothetical protein